MITPLWTTLINADIGTFSPEKRCLISCMHFHVSRKAQAQAIAVKVTYPSFFFTLTSKKGFNKSMGTGKMVVELFSVAISRRVCK